MRISKTRLELILARQGIGKVELGARMGKSASWFCGAVRAKATTIRTINTVCRVLNVDPLEIIEEDTPPHV